MANRDWLGLKNELPKQRRLVLVALSFVVPLLLWSAVSYVPWLWHPLVRVTAPGDMVLEGGSGAGVFRPHGFFYFFPHEEIRAMIPSTVLRCLEDRKSVV